MPSNKLFKAKFLGEYDEWLSTDGIKNLTGAGNLKSPSRPVIAKWILKTWEELTQELVSRSFKPHALNMSVDGSEDDAIHCFQCSKISLNEPEINPFVGIEGSRDEKEPPPFMKADEDEEDDIDIEL